MNPVNPDNEPKLPSFKSPQKKEEKKSGALPTGKEMPSFLKSFPKGTAPMMRVRGFGGGASLMERLKSLRKKDLAFIAAGLSVLVMAPLAEHFLMSPEDQAGQLQKGFSSNSAFPGDVGSIYDPGAGGFSPGGLLGQGSDVITPLNVRDPSALIMGPGATQKPSATVEAPPPPKADTSSWKDALTSAAQKGAGAATRKASLPMPHPKLAAGMRGLGAVGGGGGGSYSLPALSASNVPNRAGGSGSLMKVQASPGFRGAASRSTAAGGGSEAMRAGAARQGDIMNKGGSAGAALDQAAKEAIPGGKGFGGGGPGGGDETKSPGYAKPDHNKNLGESLAYLRQKMEMEKALDLKWKKKAWYEFERQKMIEESIIKSAIENLLGKGLFEPMGKAMGDLFGNLTGTAGPAGYICLVKGSDQVAATFSAAQWAECKKTMQPYCTDKSKYTCIPYGGGASGDSSASPAGMSGTDLGVNQQGGLENIARQGGVTGASPQTSVADAVEQRWSQANTAYGDSTKALEQAIAQLDPKDARQGPLQKQLAEVNTQMKAAKTKLSSASGQTRKGITSLNNANKELKTALGVQTTASKQQGTVVQNGNGVMASLSYKQADGFVKDGAEKKLQAMKTGAQAVDSQTASTPENASTELGNAKTSIEAAKTIIEAADAPSAVFEKAVAAKDSAIGAYNAGSPANAQFGPDSPLQKAYTDARVKFNAANDKAILGVSSAEKAHARVSEAMKQMQESEKALREQGMPVTKSDSAAVKDVEAAYNASLGLKKQYEGLPANVKKKYNIDEVTIDQVTEATDQAALTPYIQARDNTKTLIEKALKREGKEATGSLPSAEGTYGKVSETFQGSESAYKSAYQARREAGTR